MNGNLLQIAVPLVGMAAALIATYVSLHNRALVAEVRKEMAELEGRVLLKANGTYERLSESELRADSVQKQLASVVQGITKDIDAAILRDAAMQTRLTALIGEIGAKSVSALLREETLLAKVVALAADLKRVDDGAASRQ
jgi:hypothetical protein